MWFPRLITGRRIKKPKRWTHAVYTSCRCRYRPQATGLGHYGGSTGLASTGGSGSALIQAEIALARTQGYGAIFVLGNRTTMPALALCQPVNLDYSHNRAAPDDTFTVLKLKAGAHSDFQGAAKYEQALREP